MKIVRLEPDRVRVFISEGDLLEMEIDVCAITPDSPKLSAFLCRVMDAVKEETGFSAEDGQILAEATPKQGGIILELSHIKENVARTAKKESAMFEISGFENLSAMLKNTPPAHLLNMRLYIFEKNFYLAVPRRRVPAIVYEFSLRHGKSPLSEAKIAEYGRLVAGGYRLICMAAALKKIK